ncbi:MAG: hypothetical protein AMJ43_07910 [Coxiella sp. DG_40]|nr:MAG: hypothetical protein AMJ43_07910 [Coxiella sp. DG_40]
MNNVCDNLRKLRKINGLTQQQMADILGVTRMMYSIYENKKVASLDKLQEIADFFNVDVDYFFKKNED